MLLHIWVHKICNLYPKSYRLWRITEIEVFKLFLQHELYLSNESVMGHLPSSLWNILLKTKPFFNAYSILFFFSLYSPYLLLLMWLLFNQIYFFILAWKQMGSGMLGSVNKQDA